MAGRWGSGLAQLSLAIIGFGLVMTWFVMTMIQYYGQISGDTPFKSHAGLALWGVFVFASSWCWALITSISLLRQTKTEGLDDTELPPPIINPRK
jgi:hypothetical protein